MTIELPFNVKNSNGYRPHGVPMERSANSQLGSILIFLLIVNAFLIAQVTVISALQQQSESTYSTDADLKRSITEHNILWVDLSDWDRVNVIRHWVARHVIWSSANCLPPDNVTYYYYAQNASTMFNAFSDGEYRVMCGGTSVALMKVYQLFDYESYVVNMGKIEYDTHVVTLVYINIDGKRILSVQDASFDVSFTDDAGCPLDYFDMLSMLRTRDHDRIKFFPSNDTIVSRRVVRLASENLTGLFPHYQNFTVLEGGRRLYIMNMSFALYPKLYVRPKMFENFLIREGYPGKLIYGYLFPFEVNGYTERHLAAGLYSGHREIDILKRALEISGRSNGIDFSRRILSATFAILIVSAIYLYYGWVKRSRRTQQAKTLMT